jgi:hypothetical protein
MPAAVRRNAIAAFRHRFTLRQTRRTVPIMFSIELVQASERLSVAGKPRVDLDDQEVQLGQVRRHPLGQPFCRQCHEPARGR